MTDTPQHPQAPRQKRSQKTLDTLLQATIQTLDQQGLEACTLPRIAAAANISAAAVYRRFADKDELLRAAFLQATATAAPASEKDLLRPTLQLTAERIVSVMMKQHRLHQHLFRARTAFLETQTDTAFATQILKHMATNLQRTAAVLLHHKDRIRHPDAERAATFAILAATSSIEAATGPTSFWAATMPLSDKQLCTEVARAVIAYLRRKP